MSQNALRSSWQQPLGKTCVLQFQNSYLQENQELQTTCTLSMTYQINAVNKQLVPRLN